MLHTVSMLAFIQVVTAVLAAIAALGSLAIVVVRVVAPESSAGELAARVVSYRIQVTTAVGVVATLGSMYFSEIEKMVPCRMCWYQRTMMYPIAVIGIVAVIRRDRLNRSYFLALAAIGFAVSVYHNIIEWFPSLESTSCSAFGPACSLVYFRTFGIFSLATMALCGFFAVLVLNLVTFPSQQSDAQSAIAD